MTETMTLRPATDAETAAYYGPRSRNSYRHGTYEIYAPHAKNGVAHRRRTTAKMHVVDGVLTVTRKGVVERLYATHITLPSGTTLLCDLRTSGAAEW